MDIIAVCRHIFLVFLGVFLLLGVPFICTDFFRTNFISSNTDTVSSASGLIEAVSGDYLVLVNGKYHRDEGQLEEWKRFFLGEENTIIQDTAVCSVGSSDPGAQTLAESFCSRLGKDQMRIQISDPFLLFSRSDHRLFDVVIMSREFAESFNFREPSGENIVRIRLTGGSK